MGFNTEAIDAANVAHCSAPPISMGATNQGEYTRDRNPTLELLESAMARLEGGEAAMVMASGMSAISHILLRLVGQGDRIVTHNCVYVSAEWLLWDELTRFGVEISGVDMCDLSELKAALRDNAGVVYLETIANPSLDVPDMASVVQIAHEAGAKVVVDNTFASPYLCRPLDCGADVVVESATKYLSGHGDALGGVVVSDSETIKGVRWSKELHGGAMSPLNAFLILRGIETLGLRMERQCANAAALARFLDGHEKVDQVVYPGLPAHRCHEVASRQLRAPGAIIGLMLKAGRDGAEKMSEHMRLVKPWVSLGDVRSLHVVTRNLNPRSGVPGGFVRISVGAEDIEDIIADFEQALAAV